MSLFNHKLFGDKLRTHFLYHKPVSDRLRNFLTLPIRRNYFSNCVTSVPTGVRTQASLEPLWLNDDFIYCTLENKINA